MYQKISLYDSKFYTKLLKTDHSFSFVVAHRYFLKIISLKF